MTGNGLGVVIVVCFCPLGVVISFFIVVDGAVVHGVVSGIGAAIGAHHHTRLAARSAGSGWFGWLAGCY